MSRLVTKNFNLQTEKVLFLNLNLHLKKDKMKKKKIETVTRTVRNV